MARIDGGRIAALLAALLLAAMLAGCTLGQSSDYDNAQNLLDAGSYDKAYEAFSELGDFEDSAARAQEAALLAAGSSFAAGDYDLAVAWYEVAGEGALADAARWSYATSHSDKSDPLTLEYLSHLASEGSEAACVLYDELYGWRVDVLVNHSYDDLSSSYSALPMGPGEGSAVAQCVSYVHVSVTNSPVFDQPTVPIRIRCTPDNALAASDAKSISFLTDDFGTIDGQEGYVVARFCCHFERADSFLVEVLHGDDVIWSKTLPCSY